MERSTRVTVVVLLLVLVLGGWYVFSVTQKNIQAVKDGSPAAVSLKTTMDQSPYTDIDGNPVALDSYLGEVLVVNSWASWCPFCAQELPAFSQLAQEYSERGVSVLAINRAESGSTATAFLRTINATDGLTLVLDPDDRFYSSIGGYTMPETLFYDADGAVVMHKRGMLSYDEMKQYTEAALSASAE